jgi:hypothetical protein
MTNLFLDARRGRARLLPSLHTGIALPDLNPSAFLTYQPLTPDPSGGAFLTRR